jgi:gliding motility associated protien GldN
MIKTKHSLLLLALLLTTIPVVAQSSNDLSAGEFYHDNISNRQQPMPFPNLRQSDIVWSTMLWKTIDLNELFNQFIYYPIDETDPSGKKSLAYILWNAIVNNEITIYEDDELKIPIDNEIFVRNYTKADTIQLEIGYDEDDNELYQTIIRPHEFDGAEILQYSIREAWYVGRQDTRQDSRRLSLAPLKQSYHKFANTEELIYLGNLPLFWVPMQNPSVRYLLARHSAYINDNNLVGQPTWDWVFLYQHYTAYITRESNIYSRSISHYLTGEDALDESDLIEEKLYDIENDIWDY